MATPNLHVTVGTSAVRLGSCGSGGTVYIQNASGTAISVYIGTASTVAATSGITLAQNAIFQYTYGPNSTADTWYALAASAGAILNCLFP